MSDALQDTLAAEHAAVWLLATLGGRVSRTRDPGLAARVTAAHQIHRGRRDHLARKLVDDGLDPVAAAVAYDLPNAAGTASEIRDAALQVETRCTAIYSDLVARSEAGDGAARAWAIRALLDSAVRQLSFGGTPTPLPGT